MSIQIKRVVAAVDGGGRSVIQEDAAVPAVTADLMPGTEYFPIWGLEGPPPPVGNVPVEGATKPFFPAPGGTRFGVLTFPPEERGAPAPEAPEPEVLEKLAADLEGKMPGLLAAMEPDAPGFHTTKTVDYDIVIQGELTLELDDGAEATLPTGTCIVQNGTRHAWHNYGTQTAILAFVIVASPDGG